MQKQYLYLQRRHNNGMHPTANSVVLIRETCANQVVCAAGDAGR